MRLPKFTSLYGRIFSIFWFTMFLVILVVLALPRLDPRLTREISPHHNQGMLKVRDRIEGKLKEGHELYRALEEVEIASKNQGRERKLKLFITDLDGNLVKRVNGSDARLKMLRNFVTSSDDPLKPQQRVYNKTMLSGPFPIRIQEQDFFLYVGANWNQPPNFLLQLFDHPFRLLLAVMLVSTPLLLWLAWALSQPARRLEQAAQRVSKGVFETDPSLEKGTSEFRQAGASFNQMVEAVNMMICRQQRLLSDISHELRSPLTRLKMAQALAIRKQGESSELIRIDTEAQRLEHMIGKLLELSSVQVDSHLHRETHSLTELWGEVLSDDQFEAEQKGKRLFISEVPDRQMVCYPELLMSALENTIRNGIHYSTQEVRVTFEERQNQLFIFVEDDGAGVPDEELDSIFRPFYRVSTARDRNSGGTGLGLAITESAIRQHNGSVRALSSELGGLMVEIILPLEDT